jgi:hypothetical protein
MRTDKQLIEIAIVKFYLLEEGLCSYVRDLVLKKIITKSEGERLIVLIQSNIKNDNWLNRLIYDKRRVKITRPSSTALFWPKHLTLRRYYYLDYLLGKV